MEYIFSFTASVVYKTIKIILAEPGQNLTDSEVALFWQTAKIEIERERDPLLLFLGFLGQENVIKINILDIQLIIF